MIVGYVSGLTMPETAELTSRNAERRQRQSGALMRLISMNNGSTKMEIANLKLGIHRGAPRLWIEGKKLADAGFLTGDRYLIHVKVDAPNLPYLIEIAKRPNGDRKIAGGERNGKPRPIIDAHSKEWADRFPSGRVVVKFYPNVIQVIDAAVADQIEAGAAA